MSNSRIDLDSFSFDIDQIVICSQNSFYAKGGAERSLFNFISKLQLPSGFSLIILYQTQRKGLLTLPWHSLKCNVSFLEIKLPSLFNSTYLQYLLLFLSLPIVFSYFKRIPLTKKTLFISQNRWSLFPWLFYPKFSHITFIRDEKCLGIFRNYHIGVWRYIWYFANLIEMPFKLLYRFLVRRRFLSNILFVYNSRFISNLASKMYGPNFNSLILYPDIDVKNLKERYLDSLRSSQRPLRRRIIMVGTSHSKGFDTFKKLSSIFLDYDFFAYGNSDRHLSENLFIVSSVEPHKLYSHASIVIVPSIWLEAYGRVAFEAMSLGIPTIVSNSGNLPYIANEFDCGFVAFNFTQYVSHIKNIMLYS